MAKKKAKTPPKGGVPVGPPVLAKDRKWYVPYKYTKNGKEYIQFYMIPQPVKPKGPHKHNRLPPKKTRKKR